MNIIVLSASGVGVIVFWMLLTIFIRTGRPMMQSLVYGCSIGLIVAAGVGAAWLIRVGIHGETFLSALIYCMLITGCAAFLYTIGIFGIMTTSIRLDILTRICSEKGNQLATNQLYRIYSINAIIEPRIERLVAAGELQKIHNKLAVGNRLSFFIVNEKIVSWFQNL